MDKPIPNIAFQGMKLSYKARDLIRPRQIILSEAPIKTGDAVLDYGCGTGSYTFIVSKIVGPKGRVVAVDIHPLAITHIKNAIENRDIKNIEPVLTDCDTGLDDDSIDVILLFDIFHMFRDPNRNLREMARVLKKDGTLSFSDHHLDDQAIISGMTSDGLFELAGQADHTFSFKKIK
jgi:ubiquinone/menaquinone biosynthesis C-methylase UbiE